MPNWQGMNMQRARLGYVSNGFWEMFSTIGEPTASAPELIRSCTLCFNPSIYLYGDKGVFIWYAHRTFGFWLRGEGFGIGHGCIRVTKFEFRSFIRSSISDSGNGVRPFSLGWPTFLLLTLGMVVIGGGYMTWLRYTRNTGGGVDIW